VRRAKACHRWALRLVQRKSSWVRLGVAATQATLAAAMHRHLQALGDVAAVMRVLTQAQVIAREDAAHQRAALQLQGWEQQQVLSRWHQVHGRHHASVSAFLRLLCWHATLQRHRM
jgi:hypothetical protein